MYVSDYLKIQALWRSYSNPYSHMVFEEANLENYIFVFRSGEDDDEYYYVEEHNTKEPQVEQILDEVGDEDLVICDNIERALYLSLKYEFVTPLTSLVVVSPDQDPKEGDLSEVEGQQKRRHTINLINGSPKCKQTADKILSFVFLLCLSMNFYL